MLPGVLVPPSAWEVLLRMLPEVPLVVADQPVGHSERPLVEVRGCAPPLLVLTSALTVAC